MILASVGTIVSIVIVSLIVAILIAVVVITKIRRKKMGGLAGLEVEEDTSLIEENADDLVSSGAILLLQDISYEIGVKSSIPGGIYSLSAELLPEERRIQIKTNEFIREYEVGSTIEFNENDKVIPLSHSVSIIFVRKD